MPLLAEVTNVEGANFEGVKYDSSFVRELSGTIGGPTHLPVEIAKQKGGSTPSFVEAAKGVFSNIITSLRNAVAGVFDPTEQQELLPSSPSQPQAKPADIAIPEAPLAMKPGVNDAVKAEAAGIISASSISAISEAGDISRAATPTVAQSQQPSVGG